MIWVPNQLVGAMEGDDVVLECHSEAYPKSINYWTKLNGDIIVSGKHFQETYVSKLLSFRKNTFC